MRLSVLYRGSLSSCNYACGYCPFAKRSNSRRELAADRLALRRFLDWARDCSGHELGILFTPWGEALIRRCYQEALIELTHLEHVWKAAIQTNLSCSLRWLDRCRLDRLALWTTFHPTEISLARFVEKVRRVHDRGVHLSVGVVGKPEFVPVIQQLRQSIPSAVYLWINSYQGPGQKYADDQLALLSEIDPLYSYDHARHASRGAVCRTGESVFSVDAEGTMRRCHFVDEPIGNIYDSHWERGLKPRLCPNRFCDCFIGYVHLERLNLSSVFGDQVLERRPREKGEGVSVRGLRAVFRS